MGWLEDLDLSYDEINELLTDNPSLRSFVLGYAAEIKLRNMYFHGNPRITDVYKPDDHDRTEKGDWIVTYRGERIGVEVKSLQTSSLEPKRDGTVRPAYQCDASDARTVLFSDGSSVHTTALAVGEFDVVAVNIHALVGVWEFVFCKNSDLHTMEGATRGAAKNYSPLQQKGLIKTLQSVPTPLAPPYVDDPFTLFDDIVDARARGQARVGTAEVVVDDGEASRVQSRS